jgi:ATP-dependent RNA helicase RhlE
LNSFEPSGLSRSNPHAAVPAISETDAVCSPFAALGLAPTIVRATVDERYLEPTPVQREVIPAAVTGRDVLACAQTGTGKTAAFVLPILHQLANGTRTQKVRVLILTPTRELAAQIAERVTAYGRYLRFRHAVVYGGVSQVRQEAALEQHPELLIATPGRLLDLMGQGLVKLDGVAHFVLDEADRMLDMGFIHDVKRVIGALPKVRQTLFFSATVPRPIEALAASLLVDPVRVSVTPKVTAAETVDQSVIFVTKEQKGPLLESLLAKGDVERAIVFTRTKHGADRLSRRLERAGIVAPAIHGNKSQNARERALGGFRDGKTRVLIATDIAARGIDVDGVSHVFNFDLPNVPESYVHRVGRTGRAGANGRAISFCDRDERPFLADIERLLRRRVPVLEVPLPAPETAGKPRPAAAHAESRELEAAPRHADDERPSSARAAEPRDERRGSSQHTHSHDERRAASPHQSERRGPSRHHDERRPSQPRDERRGASSNQHGQRGASSNHREQRGPARHHDERRGPSPQQHERRGAFSNQHERRGPSSNHHEQRGPSRSRDEQRGQSSGLREQRGPSHQGAPWARDARPGERRAPQAGRSAPELHRPGRSQGADFASRGGSVPRRFGDDAANRSGELGRSSGGSAAQTGQRPFWQGHRPARRGGGSNQN